MSNARVGMHRNPFRFLVTPNTPLVVSDVWFPLSDTRVPAAFWDFVRSDGGDIRVTTQDGLTQVPFQLVGFDSTAKVGSLFIRVNSATAFYIYFGNRAWTGLAATATYGSQAVWESRLAGVWHGQDLTDSTANQNVSTSTNPPTVVSGKVGRGLSFDGNVQYLDCGNAPAVQINGDISILWWSNTVDNLSLRGCLSKMVTGKPASYDLYYSNTGVAFLRGNGSVYGSVNATTGAAAGSWQHMGVVMSGTSVYHYLNGVLNGSSALSTTVGDGGTPLRMGNRSDGAVKMKGVLNEVRLYSRALTTPEVAQHNVNQNTPGTFWASVGPMSQS